MITLVALPTIWLVNRDEGGSSSRPNVAAVGLDPGQADAAAATDAAPQFDPLGTAGAAYLDPLAAVEPPLSAAVEIGTTPDEHVANAKATYNREVAWDQCLFGDLGGGQEITVVNVANGRSIECVTSLRGDLEPGVLIMHQHRFQEIAELTAAPIHVAIRQ